MAGRCAFLVLGFNLWGAHAADTSQTWYNLTDNGNVAQDFAYPCMQCRRMFSPAEQALMNSCTSANFTVRYCKCFEIYCSGLPQETKNTQSNKTAPDIGSMTGGEENTTENVASTSGLSVGSRQSSSGCSLHVPTSVWAVLPSAFFLLLV